MIRSGAGLEPDAVVRADVAVIGAGLAGIDLARHLARNNVRVALVESGRLEFDAAIQELARASFVGKPLRTPESDPDMSLFLPPMLRGHCRMRQFGGTSTVWTGKWRHFDPWDFDARSWIPLSGWPIELEELRPYHREVARDYALGDFDAEAEAPFFRNARSLLAPNGLEPHLFYWERTPTRSGSRFVHELKNADNMEVVLGATATEILLHENLTAVRAIRCTTLERCSFTVEADRFILATGGLEAPRLLLASDHQLPQGIGNRNDLVGRYFMDHPKSKGRRLKPGRTARRLLDGFRDRPRPRFGISVALSGEVQRQQRLPNHALFLSPVFHTRYGLLRHFDLKLSIDQVPNRESRVYLGSESDAVGVRKLVVDWRFTDYDHTALEAVQRRLITAFASSGLGALDLAERPVTLDEMTDASHHMGTTRMAEDGSTGVVDRDCRVFGTDNLFIAGSAVFPTGHAYSPSFTIVALTRRLGHHLSTLHANTRSPVVAS